MPGDYTNGLVLVARVGKSRCVVKGHPQGRSSCLVTLPAWLLRKVAYPRPKVKDERELVTNRCRENNWTAGARGRRRSGLRSAVVGWS